MKCKSILDGLSLNPYPHIAIENYVNSEDFELYMNELAIFEEKVRQGQDTEVPYFFQKIFNWKLFNREGFYGIRVY